MVVAARGYAPEEENKGPPLRNFFLLGGAFVSVEAKSSQKFQKMMSAVGILFFFRKRGRC